MLTRKTFSVTLTSVALCLFCIGSSNALKLTMNPSNGSTVKVDSSSGYTYHSASITTSEAFSVVEWRVDQVLKLTTNGDGNQTADYFCPDPISGSLNGQEYTIEVVAKLLNDDEEEVGRDSASYTLKVFSPSITFGNPTHTNTSGYVKLTRLYYENPYAMSDGEIYLRNWNPKTLPNRQKGKTYHYDGEARLDVITTGISDSKCIFSGSLKPGEPLYIPCLPHSINLNSEADTKGKWHTVQATYTIRVNDGHANRTDTRQLNLTYVFKHE